MELNCRSDGRRTTEGIYFPSLYGIIRLKDCFSIELLSSHYFHGAKKNFLLHQLFFLLTCCFFHKTIYPHNRVNVGCLGVKMLVHFRFGLRQLFSVFYCRFSSFQEVHTMHHIDSKINFVLFKIMDR